MNRPNYFPELDYDAIKALAHRWGNQFPVIDTIILYGSSDKNSPYLLDFKLTQPINHRSQAYINYLSFPPMGRFWPTMNAGRDLLQCFKIVDTVHTDPLNRFLIHKGINPEDWQIIDGLLDEQADAVRTPDIFWMLYARKPEPELLKQAETAENAFICKGDNWIIRFKGNEFDIRNLDGVRYIAYMLRNPNVDFYANQLYTDIKGVIIDDEMMMEGSDNFETMSEDEYVGTGINVKAGGDYDNEDSPEELKQMEEIAGELYAEYENAMKSGEGAKDREAKTQWERTIEALRVKGYEWWIKGGRLRLKYRIRQKSQAHNRRTNITHALDTTKKRMRKTLQGLNITRDLVTYLDKTIKTGYSFRYEKLPDDPIEFIVYP